MKSNIPARDSPVPATFLEALEAIYRLAPKGAPVALDALARRLGLSPAQVAEKALGLQGTGLAEGRGADRVALTAEGERLAVGLVRKHRLLERFLVDVLELPWEEVHEEASRLTPVLSDRAANRLAKFLGDPQSCPHGNPIPSADGALRPETAVPLSRLGEGRRAVILRIEQEHAGLLRHLATLGLLPETTVEVEEVAPFGGPVLVRVGSARYALGRKIASKILVREAQG